MWFKERRPLWHCVSWGLGGCTLDKNKVSVTVTVKKKKTETEDTGPSKKILPGSAWYIPQTSDKEFIWHIYILYTIHTHYDSIFSLIEKDLDLNNNISL